MNRVPVVAWNVLSLTTLHNPVESELDTQLKLLRRTRVATPEDVELEIRLNVLLLEAEHRPVDELLDITLRARLRTRVAIPVDVHELTAEHPLALPAEHTPVDESFDTAANDLSLDILTMPVELPLLTHAKALPLTSVQIPLEVLVLEIAANVRALTRVATPLEVELDTAAKVQLVPRPSPPPCITVIALSATLLRIPAIYDRLIELRLGANSTGVKTSRGDTIPVDDPNLETPAVVQSVPDTSAPPPKSVIRQATPESLITPETNPEPVIDESVAESFCTHAPAPLL